MYIRVEATLSSLGWERIHDKNDTKFYLKWVECKRNLDFASFREGEQLVNHIPNGNLLTTKIGLLTSLQKFERVSNTVPSLNRRSIHMKDFVPETFRLQNQAEIQTFIQHIYQGLQFDITCVGHLLRRFSELILNTANSKKVVLQKFRTLNSKLPIVPCALRV